MISFEDAIASVRLSAQDSEKLRLLEINVDGVIRERFQGGPFVVRLSADTSPVVIAMLAHLYEKGGWCVEVYPPDGTPLEYRIRFAPSDTATLIALGLCRDVARMYSATIPDPPPVVSTPDPPPVVPLTDFRANRSGKPLVCLVSDVRGWAFDRNMQDMAIELVDRFNFEHFYVFDWNNGARTDWHCYDVIYECYHRNPKMGIPKDRLLGSLRSQWFRPELPESPTPSDIAFVNDYCAFHIAVRSTYEQVAAGCPRAVYLTNPIAHCRFTQAPLHGKIIAEWNGNARHAPPDGRLIKHFYDVVVPACERSGAALVAAEYGTTEPPYRRRSFEEMPEFYRQANVALCASEYEAASYSVMEAMASGLALIATDVGNHREMRDSELEHLGDSGIVLIDVGSEYDCSKMVEAFADALASLTPQRAREMGEINRAEIAARWSWDAWKDRYAGFLRMGL